MAEAKHLSSAVAGFFSDPQNAWLPPFTETIEGLTVAQAAWRPADGLHSVWEITNHVRFWHEVILRQLQGQPVDRAALGAEDGWPPADPQGDDADWQAAAARAVAVNHALAAFVAALPDEQLDAPRGREGKGRGWKLLHGLIAHTAYHTAQVVMLRRLQGVWIVDWRERAASR